jgi:hypothetical protein
VRLSVRTFVVAALMAAVAAGAVAVPVRAEGPAAEPAAAPVAAPVAAVSAKISGHWTGAKLRCQKEEGKMVRCGTPTPFEITFVDDGTGSTPDENLPKEFTWRWTGAKELGMTPKSGGKEIKLFGVEHEDESILSFQAYVYLPTADPDAPAEVRYIHYVFDVSRAQ